MCTGSNGVWSGVLCARPVSRKSFSVAILVKVINKSSDIAVLILISEKKDLHRDCTVKFSKCHFRAWLQQISAYAPDWGDKRPEEINEVLLKEKCTNGSLAILDS